MKTILRFFFLSLCCTPISQMHAQWIQTSLDSVTCLAFAVNDGNLFAGTVTGVFVSTNGGTDWTAVNSGLTETYVTDLIIGGTNLFAGTYYGSGVFFSSNNGANWTQTSLDSISVGAFAVDGTNLFVGTADGKGSPSAVGIFISTNNGMSWSQTSLDSGSIGALAISGTSLFAGTPHGVILSTDHGTSWNQTSLDSGSVGALAVSGTNLFAGINGYPGIYLSTNNGTSWTEVNDGLSPFVTSLAISGTNLFAGTYGYDGVYVTANNGTSWTGAGSGLYYNGVLSITILGTNLFVGTQYAGVWRRPLSEIITSVERHQLPGHFNLEQNCPNPFNPSTEIAYRLPFTVYCSLKIFDLLGREVATLVDEEEPAGVYTAVWNAAVSSGVYFYRLEAIGRDGRDFVETKKMVLAR